MLETWVVPVLAGYGSLSLLYDLAALWLWWYRRYPDD